LSKAGAERSSLRNFSSIFVESAMALSFFYTAQAELAVFEASI
jgi:hypothetical protein